MTLGRVFKLGLLAGGVFAASYGFGWVIQNYGPSRISPPAVAVPLAAASVADPVPEADESWYILSATYNTCVTDQYAESPAKLVASDASVGVTDDVSVLEKSHDKPVMVKVYVPQRDQTSLVWTFYRGWNRCAAASRKHQADLDNLK